MATISANKVRRSDWTRKRTTVKIIMFTLKALITSIVSHEKILGVRTTSAFTAVTNIRQRCHHSSKTYLPTASFLYSNNHSNSNIKSNKNGKMIHTKIIPFFLSRSSSSSSGDMDETSSDQAKKELYKPKSKKLKLNPNWKKEYDESALAEAFAQMAKKEGFDESMEYVADDATFEDDFIYDELDEDDMDLEEEEEEDDFIDFGMDNDNEMEQSINLQSKESMAARIAAAKSDISSGKVSVPKAMDAFAEKATMDDLQNIGFKRELNPFGPDDETPRQESFQLVTDARSCSACGAAFQSKDENRPGYLPPAKHQIQMKLVQIEEMQKLQEKADSFEWSPEDEIEWLIQTSGGAGGDAAAAAATNADAENTNTANSETPSDIDIHKLADELGLDLVELSKKKTICKRCHGLQNFGTVVESLRPGHTDEPLLSQDAFRELLMPIREKTAVIIALVDIFDFGGSVLPELDFIAGDNPVILAANKADLLPSSMGQRRVENWVRRELEYMGIQSLANIGGAVRLVSCKTGFGLSSMMRKARDLAQEKECDIYVVGAANAGKSTLINHILEKNAEKKYMYKKKRAGNANARKGVVTTSPLPGTTLKFIKVDLGGGMNLYDTPGLLVAGTLTQLLTPEELKMVVPKKQIEAITFRIESGKCVLVGGLARIEIINDSKPFLFTFFVGNDIKLHPTSVVKADDFIAKHAGKILTPPLGNGPERMEEIGEFETHDLEIDGMGWNDRVQDFIMTRKGNGPLPNVHFRKEWQNYVRTWFDQPMRKKKRNVTRVQKARKIAPKPVAGALRPQVTCQTFKYHTKLRAGRGFTLEELKMTDRKSVV